MIDPLASVAAVPPVRPVARPPAASVEVVAAPVGPAKSSPEPNSASLEHKQLAMDVKKGNDGVFVYTLSDPETHAVIVVIPRKDVDGSQEGQAVDKRV